MSSEKNKKTKVLEINNNIETSLNEITNVEKLITKIIGDENFDKLNNLTNRQSKNKNALNLEDNCYEFISVDIDTIEPYSNLITEKEFFNIVEANKKRSYKRAGIYQQSLYSRYIEAKREQDSGYIKDILNKAIILRKNINETETLMRNKPFMREWRRNFGKVSPIYILKKTGKMKQINIIRRMV